MVHGVWCETKTYPTRCRFCHQEVFFFTCDCGSKVSFDELGPPWTKHGCDGYTKYLQDLPIHRLLEQNELRIRILTNELRIAELRLAIDRLRRDNDLRPITRALPSPGTLLQDVGVVRELEHDVDVYKKTSFPRTLMAAKFLGPLAIGHFAQVTVHTSDLASKQLNSYTFFVDAVTWSNVKNASRGDLLCFALKGEILATGYPYWRCTKVAWPL